MSFVQNISFEGSPWCNFFGQFLRAIFEDNLLKRTNFGLKTSSEIYLRLLYHFQRGAGSRGGQGSPRFLDLPPPLFYQHSSPPLLPEDCWICFFCKLNHLSPSRLFTGTTLNNFPLHRFESSTPAKNSKIKINEWMN